MKAIEGVWKDGQVLLREPTDWPEGTPLLIEPMGKQSIGIREEDWRDSPEAIEEWIKWYDSLEPLEITPEEEAELAAWRQKIKEYTIANMHKRIDGLFP